MKYAVSLFVGLIIGIALFVMGLYYNPFVGNPSVSPLAISDLELVNLSYSLVPNESIIFTNNGEANVPEQQPWGACWNRREIFIGFGGILAT
jgi:hypothetical protein